MSVQCGDIIIKAEIITELRSLRQGDQLAVEGEAAGIQFYHHGIFLGHEKGVADFGGGNTKDAQFRVVDLLPFIDFGRKRLVRIHYPDGICFPPEKVIENAENIVDNPNCWGPYSVLSNNCEHFATKCKTGIADSPQVSGKIRECIMNPLKLVTCVTALYSAGGSGSGSLSLSGSLSGSTFSSSSKK